MPTGPSGSAGIALFVACLSASRNVSAFPCCQFVWVTMHVDERHVRTGTIPAPASQYDEIRDDGVEPLPRKLTRGLVSRQASSLRGEAGLLKTRLKDARPCRHLPKDLSLSRAVG